MLIQVKDNWTHLWQVARVTPRRIDFQRLDARTLLAEGQEPLPVIRKRIQKLQPGQGLVVIAPFLPAPLIEMLRSQGYQSRVEPGGGGDWIVYFWQEAGLG